jgi:hypothetical protein
MLPNKFRTIFHNCDFCCSCFLFQFTQHRDWTWLGNNISTKLFSSFSWSVYDWVSVNPLVYLRPLSCDVFRWAANFIAVSLQWWDNWLRFNTQCFICDCIPFIFSYFLTAHNTSLLKAFSTRQGTRLPGGDVPSVSYNHMYHTINCYFRNCIPNHFQAGLRNKGTRKILQWEHGNKTKTKLGLI